MTLSRDLLLHPLPGVLRRAALERVQPGMRVVVPNVQAGIEFKRELTIETSCITLTQLARESLRQAGWSALKPAEALRFFESSLEKLDFAYLEPIRARRSTSTVLYSLITELERDHIDPDDLLRVAAPGREHDVALAYFTYHATCQTERRYDAAGAEHFAALLPHIEAQPLILSGFGYFDPAQLGFIQRKLAAGSVVTLPATEGAPASLRSLESARQLQNHGFQPVLLSKLPQNTGDAVTQAYWDGSSVSPVAKAEFDDVDSEVRACLREVRAWLAEGTPPEQIALIVRREELYLETLADVAAEYRIPLVSGAQRSLLQTGLGSLLQTWIDAHRAEWRFTATQALLTHPLLNLPFDPSERARQLRSQAPRGLAAWSPEVTWLALPPETTWRGGLVGVVQRLITEMGVWARCKAQPQLNTSLSLLLDRLRVEARRTTACTREQLLSAVSFTLRDIRLPVMLHKSAVRVVNPLGALGRPFDKVWILGLSDTIFPAVRQDHPLIDATVRRHWREQGVDVPDLSRFAGVEEALFLGSVAAAHSTLVLSRPRQDLGGRRLAPSPLWERLHGNQAMMLRPHASTLERDIHRALASIHLPEGQLASGKDQAGSAGHLKSQAAQLTQGINVSERLWTLEELKVATTCRYRWWTTYVLGVTPPPALDWDELRKEALHDVLNLRAKRQIPLNQLVAPALDRVTARLRAERNWSTGSLWPAQRLEVLAQLQTVVSHPDFIPVTWRPATTSSHRTLLLSAHAHRYTIHLTHDRIDHTPRGHVMTVYRSSRSERSSRMDLDQVMALMLQGSQASSGRYLSTTTGEAFSTLGQVTRPTDESPITQVRAHLAELGDALAMGDIAPSRFMTRQVCDVCPFSLTCRLRSSEVAA